MNTRTDTSLAMEVDLYELTMAQVYFEEELNPESYFEWKIEMQGFSASKISLSDGP